MVTKGLLCGVSQAVDEDTFLCLHYCVSYVLHPEVTARRGNRVMLTAPPTHWNPRRLAG